ncbi:GAF domain-containing protein [Deinococcus aestuarii]|uniref:GAF domain-containing protein n=1 Tax=Deinococcus aestuarii TaxID=2774531 RepID=UPI001C0DA1E1|nr:GAF domain-containing protein [Deinococcus aestuarii]
MTIPDPVLPPSLPWLDALPDPGLLVDLAGDGRVCYANPAAARHFMLDLPSLRGRALQDLWPDLALHLASPDPWPRTLRLQATGPWVWVDVRVFPVDDLVAVQLSNATAQQAAEVRGGALFALAGALSRALTAEEAAGVVLGQGLAALGAATGSVFVLDAEREDLVFAGSVGYDEAYMGSWRRFPLSAPTLLGDAVRAGEPLFLSTAEVDARYPHLQVQRTVPTRSVAALPLLFGGQAVGVMNFGFAAEHALEHAERLFLLALAEGLAQALERARLQGAQERAHERAILLADAGELLTASADPQAVLDHLAHLVVPTVADWCTVALPDGQGLLSLRATAHRDPQKVEVLRRFRERVPIRVDDDHPLARVLHTGEVFLLPELEDVASTMPGNLHEQDFTETTAAVSARSILAVPLIARGEVLGVLSLVSQTPGHFGAEDLPFTQELARRAALALDNAWLSAEREAALAEARAERARLAAVLENAPAVGFLKDRAGRYGYVNAAFEALFEVRRQDVLGRTDLELFGEAVGGPLRENDLFILSGGTPSDFEESADTPRGRVVYRSVKFPLPGEDGAVQGIGGLSLDITGQRAAQDALEAV